MSTPWVISCANSRCRHVSLETDWISRPKANPTPVEAQLNVRQRHCPRCDCTSYVKANARESERISAQTAGI